MASSCRCALGTDDKINQRMLLIAGMLAFGVIVAFAAVLVVREAGRIARKPPPALFDAEDAYEWVVDHLPDDMAATLTPEDVRRILDFQLEFFTRKGVTGTNGSKGAPVGPAVVGGAETVAYILERTEATGETYLPEQVHAVVETQLGYLRAIGAIGPPAGTDAPSFDPPPLDRGGDDDPGGKGASQ